METETTFLLNMPEKSADVVENIDFLSNLKFSALSLSADNSTCFSSLPNRGDNSGQFVSLGWLFTSLHSTLRI